MRWRSARMCCASPWSLTRWMNCAASCWQSYAAERLFRRRAMTLQDRLRRRIGFLQIDAPVFELLKRNRHAGYGAADKCTWPNDAEIAVKIFYFRLAIHRRVAIITIEQKRPPMSGAHLNIVGRPCERNPRISFMSRTKYPAHPGPRHRRDFAPCFLPSAARHVRHRRLPQFAHRQTRCRAAPPLQPRPRSAVDALHRRGPMQI